MTRGARYILLSLLAFLAAVPVSAKRDKEVITLDEADQFAFDSLFIESFRQKNVDNLLMATNMMLKCYNINPESPAVCYELGELYILGGNDEGALYFLRRAAKLDPGNYHYLLTLAHWYSGHDQTSQAIDTYTRLLELFPDKEDSLYDLSLLYSNSGQYRKAIEVIDKMEKRQGVNRNFTMEKARLRLQMNDRRGALAEIDALIRRHPQDAVLWVYKGDIETLYHRYASALNFYNKSMEISPENGFALVSLCSYYNRAGDNARMEDYLQRIFKAKDIAFENKMDFLQETINHYSRVPDGYERLEQVFQSIIEAEPENATAHLIYADMLIHLQRPDDAKEELRTATYLDPECSDCWWNLFKITYEKQDSAGMRQILADAMEAVPESPEFYYFSGVLAMEDGDDSTACHFLKKAERYFDGNSQKEMTTICYTLLSTLEYRNGDKLSSMNHLQKALSISPDDAGVLNDYAYYLALDNLDLERAERMSARAVEQDPLNASFLDTYAYILMKRQNYHNAFFYIQRAMEYDKSTPTNPEITEHCGDILYFLGSPDDALRCWRQSLLDGNPSEVLKRKIQNKRYEE